MAGLTYRELRDYLNTVSDTQLDDNVSVNVEGEFFSIEGHGTSVEDDILHKGHVYLVVAGMSE